MLPHKNYIDIKAFQTKWADAFQPGDNVQISFKLDGSNASIEYNPETGVLDCFSRKQPLSPSNPLNGFYEYVQRLDVKPFKKYIGFRIFGEWNLKHLIKYSPENIKEFWVFNVYDTTKGEWTSQEFSKQMAKDCGLHYVPIAYEGPFISWDHVSRFLDKTSGLGETRTEGVVLKNESNLNNPDSRKPFVVKLVNADYKERMDKPPREPLSMEELAKRQYDQDMTASVVTYNRVEKLLYKMITEENLLPADWDSSHMGLIAKELPRRVYADCMKEAEDVVKAVDNFGKYCNSQTMNHVRTLLSKQ